MTIAHTHSDDLPTAVLVSMPEKGQMKKFPFTGEELSAEALGGFVRSFFDGGLKPTLKSEAAPAAQPGPVHVVVGSTFASDVLRAGTDVLLEFYAPVRGGGARGSARANAHPRIGVRSLQVARTQVRDARNEARGRWLGHPRREDRRRSERD